MKHEIIITMDDAKRWILEDIQCLYEALHRGHDVSPGKRLKLEGKVELFLSLELIDWFWLQKEINEAYEHYLGQPVAEGYWQWLMEENLFCLPVKMQDAPVYKG